MLNRLWDLIGKVLAKKWVIIAVSVVLIIILLFKALDNGNESDASVPEYVINQEPSDTIGSLTSNIPTVATPQKIEIDEDRTFMDLSQKVKLVIPDGYEAFISEGYIYMRNDSDTQIIFKATTKKYDSAASVWADRSRIFRKTMIESSSGKELPLKSFGSKDAETTVNSGYEIVRETNIANYRETGDKDGVNVYGCAYYGILPSSTSTGSHPTSESREGFMICVQMPKGSEKEADMYELATEVLQSVKRIEVSENDYRANDAAFLKYESSKDDGGIIYVPNDWDISIAQNGMVIFRAPEDSIFAGMIVEYMADENSHYTAESLDFAYDFEDEILAPLFKQKTDPDKYVISKEVVKTDIDATINQKQACIFEIKDVITECTSNAFYSLTSENTESYHIRYMFESGDVNCMLNFIIPNDECRTLINQIVDKSEFQ